MSWAAKRQLQYLSGLLLVIGVVAFIFIYPSLNKQPTCFDGKKNGAESGVDCGGVCTRLCSSDVSEPIVLWSRAFHLVGNNYNLVSVISNQNKDAAVQSVNYEFRVYDTNNKLIGRRQGSTYIPPNKQFVIFESRFDAGESTIRSVNLNFTSPFVWDKKLPTLDLLPIKVDNVVLESEKDSPKLTAKITNSSIYDLPEFDVVAIVYNADHNAINASKTHLMQLTSNSSTPLLFTWPEAFGEDSATKDILVQINPFTTSY